MDDPINLTRAEIESLGPPMPEELEETGLSEEFLSELALKHVAALANPTTRSVAENLRLPHVLAELLLQQLRREKFIEIRSQGRDARYAILEHGRERLRHLYQQSAYVGPAPVPLSDYTQLMRLQAAPFRAASMEMV